MCGMQNTCHYIPQRITYSIPTPAEYSIYDNIGSPYDISRIMNEDFTLDLEKYKAYSPVFLPPSYALTYGIEFAAMTSTLVHILLYYREQIVRQWKSSKSDADDVHFRLMQAYQEVPMWWYLAILVYSIFRTFTKHSYQTQLRWYGLVVALGITGLTLVPIGIILAITNAAPSIFLLCQILAGYMFPGRPMANNLMVVYGRQCFALKSLFEAIYHLRKRSTLLAILKLGIT
ncbi:Oligopeptide transporter 1 [Neolecta irregularis DAH-3]|uniref:Oligopeptide transporter 1 n=1 Tax=Neolecta irregularis (strain DAH-3) TaxID=1198029 RepID=A0A1U7LPY8_NEOID|nr:Oligopeptide transporter 1 [Neolecta irregularis DAH-3]|eukprot:OLL24736.1 Oligopeptide transporter 1 [Neolecta irregularis DAH-3]